MAVFSQQHHLELKLTVNQGHARMAFRVDGTNESISSKNNLSGLERRLHKQRCVFSAFPENLGANRQRNELRHCGKSPGNAFG